MQIKIHLNLKNKLLFNQYLTDKHCVKSVRIRSYFSPHFPAGLNTDRYSVSLRIHSECGKIRIRITPNTDTFYVVCETHTTFPLIRSVPQISVAF